MADKICSQCGQAWNKAACGPTHALAWTQRILQARNALAAAEDAVLEAAGAWRDGDHHSLLVPAVDKLREARLALRVLEEGEK